MEAGSFVRQSLNLDARELGPVAALTAHSVCVVGFFMVARSARDAIFLERAPSNWLPWMYLTSAVAVTLVGLAYGRVADQFRRDRIAAVSAGGLAALTLLAWALLAAGQVGLWLVVGLYVLVEIAGALVVLQLWMLANDAYNPREARRIFPLVVMGGIVANIICGAVSTGLAKVWGTNSLLLFGVLLLLAAAALSIVEGRMLLLAAAPFRPSRHPTAADASSARRERSVLLRDPHLRSIAQLLTVTFLATTVVDYQFKLSARAVFSGSSLAAYFGTYYAVTGLIGLAVQVLVTRRLLERLGLLAALAVLPLGLGLGSLGFLLTGSLLAASVAQGSNVTFRYTVNDSSVQLLYLPLPPRQRALAKAWVEGIGKPAAIAVAAGILLAYQRLGGSLQLLSIFSIVLVGAWLWLLWRTRASYVFTLERTLRRRQLDLASVRLHAEGDAAAILRGALSSANPLEVEHALDLLPHVVLPEVEEILVSLLRHPAPQVRRLAVGQIAARRGLHHGNLIYQLFDDPDSSVRAEAIRAFCGMAREKAVRSVRPFLTASEVEVRSAAIAGLVQHGGLDGILTAGPALQELLRGRTADERCWGARALGDIGVRTFYQPLLELLGDTELAVRRAALQAAARLRSPELVPALIYRLGEPAIAGDAADALAAIGSADDSPSRDDLAGAWNRRERRAREEGAERLEGTLEKVLRNPLEEPRLRANVPRVLARLSTTQAARVLSDCLDLPEEPLRSQVVAALVRQRRQTPGLPIDPAKVLRAIELEIAQAQRCLACAEALQLPERFDRTVRPGTAQGATALLANALDEQRWRALERLLLLIGLLQPRIGAQGLRPDLLTLERESTDPAVTPLRRPQAEASSRRAAALELLDNLLPRALRGRVVPLWERGTRADRLAALSGRNPEPPLARSAWLSRLTADPNPWVQACALLYLSYLGDPAHAPLAERALRSEQPRIRESALLALLRLGVLPPRTTLEPMLQDPDLGVRAAAEAALQGSRSSVVAINRRKRARDA
jgi:HEAT repeat protein